MEILTLNTQDFINVTSYIICILPILQDYYFLYYQMCDGASSKINDDYASLNNWPNLLSYKIKDYNSVTLDIRRRNKRHLLDGNWLVKQMVQRLLTIVNRAKSSNRALSSLSMKSLTYLGMSIPRALGQVGHEMPLKPWSK